MLREPLCERRVLVEPHQAERALGDQERLGRVQGAQLCRGPSRAPRRDVPELPPSILIKVKFGRFGPVHGKPLVNCGVILADLWSPLAACGQTQANIGSCWQTSWPESANLGLLRLYVSPNWPTYDRHRPKLAETKAKLGSKSHSGATVGQATSELAKFARGGGARRATCSKTLGATFSLCHRRPLSSRLHHNPCMSYQNAPYGEAKSAQTLGRPPLGTSGRIIPAAAHPFL